MYYDRSFVYIFCTFHVIIEAKNERKRRSSPDRRGSPSGEVHQNGEVHQTRVVHQNGVVHQTGVVHQNGVVHQTGVVHQNGVVHKNALCGRMLQFIVNRRPLDMNAFSVQKPLPSSHRCQRIA
ncbi:hypothetical protein LSAT2_006847 [Lamellibrachia satsuma]|nr:hypothetical protein LSAT2_006847 [Lamellibrachia satsuma]